MSSGWHVGPWARRASGGRPGPVAARTGIRRRSQEAKAADCKSAIVGSTPTGASAFFRGLSAAKPRRFVVLSPQNLSGLPELGIRSIRRAKFIDATVIPWFYYRAARHSCSRPISTRIGVPVLGTVMATPPWSSASDPHYHYHQECTIGQQLRRVSSWPGDGGKPLCPECSRLLVTESRQMPALKVDHAS